MNEKIFKLIKFNIIYRLDSFIMDIFKIYNSFFIL